MRGEEYNRHKPTVAKKVLVACIVLCINYCLSVLLYWGIMELFDVDTSGFINLNSLLVAVAYWEIIALLGAVFSSVFKRTLQPYGMMIVNIQAVFFILPLFLLMILAVFMVS